MKTIKELVDKISSAESCDEVDTTKFEEYAKAKIEALEEVLELIDEVLGYAVDKEQMNPNVMDELKERITGDKLK